MAKAEYSEKLSLSLNCVLDVDSMNCEFEEIESISLQEALKDFDGKKVTISVTAENAR